MSNDLFETLYTAIFNRINRNINIFYYWYRQTVIVNEPNIRESSKLREYVVDYQERYLAIKKDIDTYIKDEKITADVPPECHEKFNKLLNRFMRIPKSFSAYLEAYDKIQAIKNKKSELRD